MLRFRCSSEIENWLTIDYENPDVQHSGFSKGSKYDFDI